MDALAIRTDLIVEGGVMMFAEPLYESDRSLERPDMVAIDVDEDEGLGIPALIPTEVERVAAGKVPSQPIVGEILQMSPPAVWNPIKNFKNPLVLITVNWVRLATGRGVENSVVNVRD
jgi:hypothetical protein